MYTQDNTVGYTPAQLEAFNAELACWLLCAETEKGEALTEDEYHEVCKRHERKVAAD